MIFNKDKETFLRELEDKDSACWKLAAIDDMSDEFIREFKDKINWNKPKKRQLLKQRGQKFYEEIFGRIEDKNNKTKRK